MQSKPWFMRNKSTVIRASVQLGSLVTLTILFLRQDYVNATRPMFSWLGWLDPLMGLAGLVQNRWLPLLILSLAILAGTLFWRRWFCGWLCPIGTILDLIGEIKKIFHWQSFGIRSQTWLTLGWIRWIILGVVTGGILLSIPALLVLNPLVIWPRTLTQLSAGMFPWSIIFIVALGGLFLPRFWCRFLCPAGSLFSIMGKLGKKRKPGVECRHCDLCRKKCPMENIDAELQFGSDCLNCGICMDSCPVRCLDKSTVKPEFSEQRRDLLLTMGAGIGTLLLGSGLKTLAVETVTEDYRWPRLLRPPGALSESKLKMTCSRCGQCLQICPAKVLVPSGPEAGVAGLWTPRFVPRRGRCMFCMACGEVCPTGALVLVPPETARLGSAVIQRRRCLAWAKKTECLLCVETCPTFAISINPAGRPVVNSALCIGCGACEANCPVEGSAVLVFSRGETRRD